MTIVLHVLTRLLRACIAREAGQNNIEFAFIAFLLTLATVASLVLLSDSLFAAWIGLVTNTPTAF